MLISDLSSYVCSSDLPASLVVLLIVIAPMLLLVRYSFKTFDGVIVDESSFTLSNYAFFFSDPYYLKVLFSTLKIAFICTLLALVLSFPVAYFLARTQSRFKRLYIILLMFPLMCGSVVRSSGWMIVLGYAGFVNTFLISLGLPHHSIRFLLPQKRRN